MDFECSGCGLCCKNVGTAVLASKAIVFKLGKKAPLLNKAIAQFPYKADANGACEQLENGKCKVYENRPDVCNVKKAFKFTSGMTRAEWYSSNGRTCNALIKMARLGDNFLVKENY